MTGTVQEVGRGCYAWLRLPGSWGETNIGLVTGERASLLIDTPWDQRLARTMLAAFEPHTAGAAITTVVNTHPDVDHWWGNAELPGAEIVSSEPCASHMRHEAAPKQMLAMRKLSQATGRIPGRAGRMGRYLGSMLAPYHFEDVTLRFPDRTFTGRRSETVGGREVEFIDYGAAHTASDAVVLVPDARVVYTGDLLFANVTPVMWHGPVSGWLAALEAIMALDADVFVPGHGPVSSRIELRALHDYWSWLSTAVANHKQAGEGVAEIAERLVRSEEFSAFAQWPSPERLYINVASLDRHLDGKGPIPGTPASRAKAFDGVACLAHRLAR